MNKPNKFLQDFHGNFSSKRRYGSLLILVGIFLKVTLIIGAIFYEFKTSFNDLNSATNYMIGFGSGLLGWGVFEGKKIIINKNK